MMAYALLMYVCITFPAKRAVVILQSNLAKQTLGDFL